MSKRVTREVESRTPKREPIVKVASRNNEQFVNVVAIKKAKGVASCGRCAGNGSKRKGPSRAMPIATRPLKNIDVFVLGSGWWAGGSRCMRGHGYRRSFGGRLEVAVVTKVCPWRDMNLFQAALVVIY